MQPNLEQVVVGRQVEGRLGAGQLVEPVLHALEAVIELLGVDGQRDQRPLGAQDGEPSRLRRRRGPARAEGEAHRADGTAAATSSTVDRRLPASWAADTVACPHQVDAGWSSQVARRAHNPKVAGSNPAPATNHPTYSERRPTSWWAFVALAHPSPAVHSGRVKTPRVILVADPGLPVELARRMQDQLPWDVSVICQRLPADDIGEVRVPAEVEIDDGQVAVIVTDHPCRDGLRPVAAEVDPDTGTGVVSLPPLGAIRLGDRAIQAVVLVVEELCGDDGGGGSSGRFRREAGETVRFMTAGRQGRLRILAGMVRANRPWRLLPHLSKAFAAALAVLAYAILNPTIWQLGSALDPWRMGLAALLAIAIMVGWLIVNHEMWERNDDEDATGSRRAVQRGDGGDVAHRCACSSTSGSW